MEKLKVGDFVVVDELNELGLVGEVLDGYVRCWWHRGGTRAIIKVSMVKKVKLEEVLTTTYSNENMKKSLIERQRRLFVGEDVSDLIDV